jgi:hypothetical protein
MCKRLVHHQVHSLDVIVVNTKNKGDSVEIRYLRDMIAAQKDTREIALKFGHCARKKCTDPKMAIHAVFRMGRHDDGPPVHRSSYAPIKELPPDTQLQGFRV